MKKLLAVLLVVVVFGLSATMVSAKHGKDDPAGDDRGGHKIVAAKKIAGSKHGKDDAPGDDRGGHGHGRDDKSRLR